MDTPQQYPTMWTTGYIGGVKVSFTFPIRNEMEAYAQAKAITDKLLADGFTLSAPGLEVGEDVDTVGYVLRKDKTNDDGTTSSAIALYPANDKATKKWLWVYLDTEEDIKAFEDATGVTLKSMKVWPTKQAPDREPSAAEYFKVVKPGCTAVYEPNPKWISEEETKFTPKRLFVRWGKNTTTTTQTTPPSPANPPPAVAQAAEPATPEPSRVAELRNEELTITRIEPRSDSAGWYGYGMFDDGVGQHETRVNLFAPEDPNAITEAGYKWVTSGKVQWPVTLRIDRNMTRIATVLSKQSSEPLEQPPSAKNDPPAVEPAWYATPALKSWGVIKGWLLSNVYAKNTFHMNGSLYKHGITVDNKGQTLKPEWANSTAGELIKYMQANRELAEAS